MEMGSRGSYTGTWREWGSALYPFVRIQHSLYASKDFFSIGHDSGELVRAGRVHFLWASKSFTERFSVGWERLELYANPLIQIFEPSTSMQRRTNARQKRTYAYFSIAVRAVMGARFSWVFLRKKISPSINLVHELSFVCSREAFLFSLSSSFQSPFDNNRLAPF